LQGSLYIDRRDDYGKDYASPGPANEASQAAPLHSLSIR